MSNESQWRDSESTVNIHKIVGAAISNLPWFIGCIIVTFIIAFLYLRYTTPIYQVNTEILVKGEKSSEAISNEALLEDLGMQSGIKNINNEMRILSSHQLMARVVRDLHLNIHYSKPGRVTTSELFEDRPFDFIVSDAMLDSFTSKRIYKLKNADKSGYVLYEMKDNKKKNEWSGKWGDTLSIPIGPVVLVRTDQPLIGKDVEYTITVTSIEKATNKYTKAVTVSLPNKQSSILQITFKDELPKRGEIILNKLVDEYQRTSIDEKNIIANNTLLFIDSEISIIFGELGGVEKTIENYKRTNEITNITKDADVLLGNANSLEQELTKDEMKLRIIEDLEKFIIAHANDRKTIPASLISQEGTFSTIISQYNSLFQKRAELMLSTTETNPIIVNIDRQLDNVEQELKLSIVSVKRDLNVSIAELKRREGFFSGEVKKIPTKEREYQEFARQQEIKQQLYLFLLKKREETAIGRSTNIANSKVVEPAKASGTPYTPVRSNIFLAAFLVGIIVPGSVIYVRNLLNTRIKSRADISAVSGLGVAGEVGHNDGEETLTVVPGSRSVIAEQFRALRTNVEFLLGGVNEKVIMITSSMSGEGKSFISLNLASTLALSGKKVVLMELDLRKPKISKYLGIDNSVGFSNYAIGQVEYNQILIPSGVQDNFFIIPSGPVPPNPSELIILQHVADLFTRLRQDFDYVVIDTAPIGFVTDAQLLNRYADTALYVVRQNYTYRQQIQFADELNKSGKMSKLNLVVNDVRVSRGYGYGYGYGYYSYGYGYGYGSYGSYFEKSKGRGGKDASFLQKIVERFQGNSKKD